MSIHTFNSLLYEKKPLLTFVMCFISFRYCAMDQEHVSLSVYLLFSLAFYE